MNKKIFWSVLVIVVLALVYTTAGQSKTEVGEKRVKVGVISILSGQFGVIGENYLKGIQLAKDQYELSHPNTKVDLVVEDDGFDVKKGISAYKKLTQIDNIDALLNLSSPTIDSIHPDVTAKNLPVVQFGIQSDGLAADPIFQISPMAKSAVLEFGTYLKEQTRLKKVAIVYENGKPFNQFHEAFLESYGEADTVSMVITNKSDVDMYATRIVHEGFDGVAILGMPESGALLIKRITTLSKVKPTYMIDAQFQTGTDTYRKILGDLKVMEGAYSVWLASSENVAFKEAFTKKYGEAPGSFADSGYDAFLTLMNAHDNNRVNWIKNLQNTKLDGATGKVTFDSNGVRLQNFNVMRVQNGEIVTEKKIELVK